MSTAIIHLEKLDPVSSAYVSTMTDNLTEAGFAVETDRRKIFVTANSPKSDDDLVDAVMAVAKSIKQEFPDLKMSLSRVAE